jgi:hypothetical protein
MRIENFAVNVADDALTDLGLRLDRTRWMRDFANDQWQYGTNDQYPDGPV